MSAGAAPIRPRILSMPARKPSAGSAGVDGVLVVTTAPVRASTATTSVNVPPVSMPIRICATSRIPCRDPVGSPAGSGRPPPLRRVASMRIPGPGDLIKLSGQGYAALERAISLVPQACRHRRRGREHHAAGQTVMTEIESTQHRATAAVTRVEAVVTQSATTVKSVQAVVDRSAATVGSVEAVVDRSAATVGSTEVVVGRAAELTRRIEPLLDRFQPALDKLEPIMSRLAETTSPAEVDAMVKLLERCRRSWTSWTPTSCPVLDTLATVAPDLRDLLDVSKELNELIGSVPGLRPGQEEDRGEAGHRRTSTGPWRNRRRHPTGAAHRGSPTGMRHCSPAASD